MHHVSIPPARLRKALTAFRKLTKPNPAAPSVRTAKEQEPHTRAFFHNGALVLSYAGDILHVPVNAIDPPDLPRTVTTMRDIAGALRDGKDQDAIQLCLPDPHPEDDDIASREADRALGLWHSIPMPDFHERMNEVFYAAADRDVRYYLRGVLFHIARNGSPRIVASESHILVHRDVDWPIPSSEQDPYVHNGGGVSSRGFIVPRGVIAAVPKGATDIVLSVSDEITTGGYTHRAGHLIFTPKGEEPWMIEFRTIDGKFPNYEGIEQMQPHDAHPIVLTPNLMSTLLSVMKNDPLVVLRASDTILTHVEIRLERRARKAGASDWKAGASDWKAGASDWGERILDRRYTINDFLEPDRTATFQASLFTSLFKKIPDDGSFVMRFKDGSKGDPMFVHNADHSHVCVLMPWRN